MLTCAQFTVADLSDPVVAGSAPAAPVADMLWLDTSLTPAVLKRWTGDAWEVVNESRSGGRNLLLNTEDERSVEKGDSDMAVPYDPSPLLKEVECGSFVFSFEGRADAEGITAEFRFKNSGDEVISTCSPAELHMTYARYTQPVSMAEGYTVADIQGCCIHLTGAAGAASFQRVMLERGNTASDWVCAPEDEISNLELKLSDVHAQINASADSIRHEVQANYAAATEVARLTEQLTSLAEQTENNFTWSVTRISELQTDLNESHEVTAEQLALIQTYMSFSEDGLVIGKTGNPFTFRVVNDRLAFYMNNTEVAYLSNNKLYVTQAEILTKMQIGKFAFEPQLNGNLSLIYTG